MVSIFGLGGSFGNRCPMREICGKTKVKVKVKVKFTLKQAKKARRGSRGIFFPWRNSP
jgi:hypothetical protein